MRSRARGGIGLIDFPKLGGRVAELVYAYASGAYGAILGSSSLPTPITSKRVGSVLDLPLW